MPVNRELNMQDEDDTDDIPTAHSSQSSITWSQDMQTNITLGQQLMKDLASEHDALLHEGNIEDFDFYQGGSQYDWHEQGRNSMLQYTTVEAIEACKTWITVTNKQLKDSKDSLNDTLSYPNVNPLLVNKKQMYVIYMTMRTYVSNKMKNIPLDDISHRLIVQGVAGTGKSQVIKIITRLCRRLQKGNKSVLNLAPTGAASILLPGGRTIHSVTNIPRLKKDSKQSVCINDEPLGPVKMKDLKTVIGTGDALSLVSLNIDERGMIGQNTLAWCSARLSAATAALCNVSTSLTESPPFGYVPMANLSGDIFQLSPIGDYDLYSLPSVHSTPVHRFGHALYMGIQHCIILDEIMRQKPSQKELIACLNNVRSGNITRQDWEKLNSRSLEELPQQEKDLFSGPDSIMLTEVWKVANEHNYNKIRHLKQPVAILPSIGKGQHHRKSKDMGQIPAVSIISKSCRVMLTKNQSELTPSGLNNGAVGTVIDIYYEKDERR